MSEEDRQPTPENVRPWGRYDILEEGEGYKTKRITVKPGQRLSYQRHQRRSETWTMVSGQGRMILDDIDSEVKAGDTVTIPAGAKHRIENSGQEPLVFIEVQTGSYFGEDDIERLDDDYGREGTAPEAAAAAEPAPEESPADGLEAKCAEYKAGWQRAMADYDNLKKEAAAQRLDLIRYGCVDLVRELMPAVEALRKAADHEPPTEGLPEDAKKWMDGVAAIRQQMEKALEKSGVSIINETKVAFDPSIHEAVMAREEEGTEADQVVEVVESGYRLHDRVIKPAKVIVSK